MSTLDDSNYVLDSSPAGFSDKERQRWNKGIEKSRKRIEAQCKHLIKAKGPWKRPKRQWSAQAWKDYLNGSAPSLDDINAGVASLPGSDADEIDGIVAQEAIAVDTEEDTL